MIERKFVAQNFKEFQIKNFVKNTLNRVGLSTVKLKRTSLGEKVIITASRPGLVVGREGATIQKLTKDLRTKFKLENPQIEIEEITEFGLDAVVIAETIVNQLERFGTQRFKGIGHKMMETIMSSGALGVEILISGRIPSSRAKTWRFAEGYMKKCGDIAITGVNTAKEFANLKSGTVGVQVRIMPGTTKLPDQITFDKQIVQAAAQAEAETDSSEKKLKEEKKPKKKAAKSTKKTSAKKTSAKKEADVKEEVTVVAEEKSSKGDKK